jgi:hypothetical protein
MATNPTLTHEASRGRDDTVVTGLVTRARNGERQAWDALVERYAPLIWSICRRYRLEAADAEGVCRDQRRAGRPGRQHRGDPPPLPGQATPPPGHHRADQRRHLRTFQCVVRECEIPVISLLRGILVDLPCTNIGPSARVGIAMSEPGPRLNSESV